MKPPGTRRIHLMRDTSAMLRELNVVEQKYRAVLEVLDGISVTEVAERFGVARQTRTTSRDIRRHTASNYSDDL